ncbi:MAG TPA: T9SS type A sorting domain-containing protein [Bacteroidales bacterium]|nr:T9SS type A sorting domain-containing protein [Bacteroidales bacterium]
MKKFVFLIQLFLITGVIFAQFNPKHENNFKWGTDSLNVNGLGHFNKIGNFMSVFVVDTVAYACMDHSLVIVDIRVKTSPQILCVVETEYPVYDVFVVNDYAYIANDEGGLRIIDVYWPDYAYEVGYLDTDGYSYGIFAEGNTVYLADATGGLKIINVSNPESPALIGTFNEYAFDVYCHDDYAYVSAYNNGLKIVNISDPANPYLESYYISGTYGQYTGVYFKDNYVYASCGDGGLKIIDVSTPQLPIEKSNLNTEGFATEVTVYNNYAYLSDGLGGVRIINIEDPESPIELGFYDTEGYANHVYYADNFVYVADMQSGFDIISVSIPSTPVYASTFLNTPEVWDVHATFGFYAFLASGNSGLRVVNFDDESNPIEFGYCETPGYAVDVYCSGIYAYVADYTEGLRIIDVATEVNFPREVGYIETPGEALCVHVQGNYAYLAAGTEGLRIIDISNPENPVEVGFYNTPGVARAVFAKGDYAYVADGTGGLRIINISNPAIPTETGYIVTGEYGEFYDVQVVDNIAYVAADWDGLRIIDVSNPNTPTEISFTYTNTYAEKLSVVDNHVFVSDYNGGLYVINTTDFQDMFIEGFYIVSSYSWGIHATKELYEEGLFVFLANYDNGFHILKPVNLISDILKDEPEKAPELLFDNSSNQLVIKTFSSNAYLRIFDANGKAVLSKKLSSEGNHFVSVEGISSGIYLGVIKDSNSKQSLKFFIGN